MPESSAFVRETAARSLRVVMSDGAYRPPVTSASRSRTRTDRDAGRVGTTLRCGRIVFSASGRVQNRPNSAPVCPQVRIQALSPSGRWEQVVDIGLRALRDDDLVATLWIVRATFACIGSGNGCQTASLGTGKPLREQSALPLRHRMRGESSRAVRRVRLHA